jgi:hypothetical protein
MLIYPSYNACEQEMERCRWSNKPDEVLGKRGVVLPLSDCGKTDIVVIRKFKLVYHFVAVE